MLLKLPHPEALSRLSCYLILWSFLCLSILPMAHGLDGDVDDSPGLTLHYKRLYKFYNAKHADMKSDCKVKGDIFTGDDPHHSHWGTVETLGFLAGNLGAESTLAEKRTNLPKLRQFLARVGYLKEPGSLVFLDKQMLTIRLTGCKSSSVWRQQGEEDEDAEFQKYYYTGKDFKYQAPSAANYIHKYTCFNTAEDKCTHTFYVITKMLPELPIGLLVREDGNSGEYDFACTVPFCQVKHCYTLGKTDPIPRKSYPPFRIYWSVPATLAELLYKSGDDNIITKGYYKNVSKDKTNDQFTFVWEDKLRVSKEAELTLASSYKDADSAGENEPFYDWKNGFGDVIKLDKDNDHYALQSRFHVSYGEENTQVGLYECVIEDANGVVTTPNVLNDEYRGDSYLHVIHDEMLITYAVALGCLLLTVLIIIICPRKLEHDDGTPYTKDELVVPDHAIIQGVTTGSQHPSVISVRNTKSDKKSEKNLKK